MKRAMIAIIRKDVKNIAGNQRLLLPMLVVPLMMTVVLPAVLLLTILLAPEDPRTADLLRLLPQDLEGQSQEMALAGLLFNSILPAFFLMIPIMTASIMAASSFVGEKEKSTLETLLYCPLTLQQIFRAKVLAAFLLSMAVSLLSFGAMCLVLETMAFLLLGGLLVPSLNWLVVLALLSPAVSLVAVTLIVRGSAKAKSVEESQQRAVFLVIPLVLLVVGQFTGLLLVNAWLLLGLALVCALAAALLLRGAMGRFTYEALLQ